MAHDYSPAIEPVKDELYKDIFDINDSHTREVIDRYTDPRLSRDLSTRIDRGLLEDVKEKMHVTTDNETPYEIAVLSLDSPHGSAHATIPSPESENSDMRDLIKEWRKGLNRRFEQFNNRLGRERPLNARAWVCIGNNQQS